MLMFCQLQPITLFSYNFRYLLDIYIWALHYILENPEAFTIKVRSRQTR